MSPAAPTVAAIAAADPVGPEVPLSYNVSVGYDYLGVAYDAASFTPGAPAMKPA